MQSLLSTCFIIVGIKHVIREGTVYAHWNAAHTCTYVCTGSKGYVIKFLKEMLWFYINISLSSAKYWVINRSYKTLFTFLGILHFSG